MHSKRTIIPKRLNKSLFVPSVVVEQRIKQGRVWSAAQNHIRLHPLKLQTAQRQRLGEALQPLPVDVSLPLSVPPPPRPTCDPSRFLSRLQLRVFTHRRNSSNELGDTRSLLRPNASLLLHQHAGLRLATHRRVDRLLGEEEHGENDHGSLHRPERRVGVLEVGVDGVREVEIHVQHDEVACADVLDGEVAEIVDGEVRSAVAERLRDRDVDLNGVGEGMRLQEVREHGLLLFGCDMDHKNARARG